MLGKEVRLRNAYVIKAERVEKDAEGNITTIFCTYDADTLSKDPADGRKVKGVIHWVSAAHALPVEIRLYDRLFSVPNPGAADDFLAVMNPESLVIKQGSRSRACRKRRRVKHTSSSAKVTSASTAATPPRDIWSSTAPLACVTPGLKSASNAHRIHETPHIAAFFLFQNQ
ncbi:glutaminyl-tRNA synthetase (plasmid) [Klebsiella aerogenes]|nr:glutaminyl-tRNA synthetase [Klebsiella aerogenes]